MKFSYDEVEKNMREWQIPEEIKELNWVGILRSGAIIAGMLASMHLKHFGILDPYSFTLSLPFRYDKTKPILLIDDTAGQSGKTFRRCSEILRGYDFRTLFYLYDPANSMYEPDYCIIVTTDWVHFPWDNDPEGAYEWKKDW